MDKIENPDLKIEGLVNSGFMLSDYFEDPHLYCAIHYNCHDNNEVEKFTDRLCCELESRLDQPGS